MWEAIGQLCSKMNGKEARAPHGYGSFYFFPVPSPTEPEPSAWMVGEYRHLTALASDVRKSPQLQVFLSAQAVRLGMRGTDLAPATEERRVSYGAPLAGDNPGVDYSKERRKLLAGSIGADAPNRRSDREKHYALYWQSQTPQSHHIVEYNHLETIGASRKGSAREIDYDRLPCVLLMAEFHQKYVTEVLRVTRAQSPDKLKKNLGGIYMNLYTLRNSFLRPLWMISEIILKEAKMDV